MPGSEVPGYRTEDRIQRLLNLTAVPQLAEKPLI